MVEEDYVSFETGKLLKEKGFDIDECEVHYDPLDNTQYDITLQMAMKWLREIHNIHIRLYRIPSKVSMVPYVGTDTEPIWEKPWIVSFTKLAPMDEIDTDFDLQEEFPTYEEAVESAIKYCLENLI